MHKVAGSHDKTLRRTDPGKVAHLIADPDDFGK
jgi:hypothetical protein